MFDTKEKEIMRWFTLLVLFVFAGFSTGATHAAWQATATIPGNSVSTGAWAPEPEDPEEPEPAGPRVVINEVMWMGSDGKANDEWIELRNMTDEDVVVGKWTIENSRSSGQPAIMIPADRVIPANGFLLITKRNPTSATSWVKSTTDVENGSMSLHNTYSSNGPLILKDDQGNTVDATPEASTSNWPAGAHSTTGTKKFWSMERNEVPGDGMLVSSWHTCDPTIMTDEQYDLMRSYWKVATPETVCGTPKAPNLSKNDPTADDYEPEIVQYSVSNTPEADEPTLQSAEVFEDVAVEEELLEEKLQDQNLGDTEEFEELESKEEEYLGEEFDKDEIDEVDDAMEEDRSEEEYIGAPSEEDEEKLEESPAIAEVVEDEPVVKEEVADAPAEDNDE